MVRVWDHYGAQVISGVLTWMSFMVGCVEFPITSWDHLLRSWGNSWNGYFRKLAELHAVSHLHLFKKKGGGVAIVLGRAQWRPFYTLLPPKTENALEHYRRLLPESEDSVINRLVWFCSPISHENDSRLLKTQSVEAPVMAATCDFFSPYQNKLMCLLVLSMQLWIMPKHFLSILVYRYYQKFAFIDINTNKSLLLCLRNTPAFQFYATV